RIHLRLAELAAAHADHRRAVLHLSRARVRTGSAPAELCQRAARSLIQLGRPELAERLLQRVLLEGDEASQASARIAKVEILLLRGHTDEAISLGQRTLEGLEAWPEKVLTLRNILGRAWMLKGALEQADEVFARNHAEAQARGLERECALALGNRGVVAHKRGDRDAAIRLYQSAAPSIDRAVAAKALANLGSIYAEAGEFELALDNLSRAMQAFSRLGSAREVAHAASNLARVYAFLGDGARAAELSGYALDRARELGESYLQASALLNLGEIALDRRDLVEAARLLSESRDLFLQVGSTGHAALATAEKARAHLLSGERAQAGAELERPVVERGARELPTAQIEVELMRGELALLLGDLHGAGRAMTRAREALLEKPDLEGPYRVYFLMGKVRLAAGDTSGAQAEMTRAARLLDQLTERVPASRRHAFLSVPRRAETLGAVEPELRMPRIMRAPLAEAASHGLVGQSAALARITRQIEPIARANTTVLIRGESGTGKEVLAQAIHDRSPRRGMPIIKVNCAAMVEDLLLSELFGHEKGAFTGAVRERKGRFEMADGGTLFLDEIGDISPKAQVALLRVLQEREFERVGGTKTLKVDVRVICATNRDLETLIAQGRFRQDLYYRLKGVMLELPPLRERMEDLPLLAQHFLTRVARERNEAARQVSQSSLELLGRHSWPGNIRELENVLSSAAIFADGQLITPACFSHIAELVVLDASASPMATAARPSVLPPSQPVEPARLSAQPDDDGQDEDSPSPNAARVDDFDFYTLARSRDLSLKDLRHQLEMQCIKRALLEAQGNISEAARLLKMKRSRLSQIVNAEPELKGACNG
ncbi:MAG: sigma 54-interacting transcriptional regulator, partial [Myxococcaceae bacterium]